MIRANKLILILNINYNRMAKFRRISLISLLLTVAYYFAGAQVNAVEFGKNRVQYKKFKWKYYQSRNFNVYYYQNGEELAKFIAQSAEKELPQIEEAAEYSLQRRANIVLYNEYADMLQSNIGLDMDWLNTGGGTRLVNNKMVVYFEADHQKLRLQVRKGIAQVLTENRLFGDDIGEVAGNQALLDLPKWLTDGYISYLAQNWSTELDDELKSEILSGNYTRFTRFAYEKPELAGHAFWFYIDEKYKKENVTYLLYLATVYKNLNKAFMQVCKKKFKEVLAEFMEYQDDKYYKDIAKRKPYPKGNYIDGFDINTRLDYFRFNVNPNKRNNSYVVTQYRKGIVRVIFNDDFSNKTLLKFGIGFLFLAGSFYIYYMDRFFADANGITSLNIFTLAYFVTTIGELCLGPIGMSIVTKLVPARLTGMMMGMWFLASAFGQFAAGKIGAEMSLPPGASLLDKLMAYTSGYQQLALYSVAAGLVLIVITPGVKRLMHGVR